MHAADYATRLRDTKTERELALELRRIPEEERFVFIVEMISVNVAVAQALANACLRRRDLLARFFEIGLSGIKDESAVNCWVQSLLPQLGYNRICQILASNVHKHPFGVGSSVYFMLGCLNNKDSRSVVNFLRLWDAVKSDEGALRLNTSQDLKNVIEKLRANS